MTAGQELRTATRTSGSEVFDEELLAAGEAHFRATRETSDRFFRERADDVSRACWDMARRFHRGGRLLVFGSGAAESDAYHVSVEFVHPVLVGKRALPALVVHDPAVRLPVLARPEDMAVGILSGGDDPATREGLRAAAERDLLTLALAGAAAPPPEADHTFVVPSDDPAVAQEVQETLYHVLWELVHVFFEHRGLL